MAEIGKDILRASHFLNRDEPVGIPTETVYGLAANALSTEAVIRIFEVKNRPSFDPLIVHVAGIAAAEAIAFEVPEDAHKMMESFSPGPVTFILKKKPVIPDLVTAGHPTVGIRIPRHPQTQLLLESLEYPLAAPSANPFGFVSPTTAMHVNQQLGDKIPYILDGGPCSVGIESTIIDFTKEEVQVLRLGGLTVEAIEEVLGYKVKKIRTSSSRPEAPGMLTAHYSPGCPVVLGNIQSEYKKRGVKNPGFITFGEMTPPAPGPEFNLSTDGKLSEAAKNLFSALRFFADKKVDVVFAAYLPENGLGRAINDRLKRAAATAV